MERRSNSKEKIYETQRTTMELNNNEISGPTIPEFYAGKNIFITGGTGFLGTVLIESLLRTTPKIGKIYLLMRDKYGSDTGKRVQRLLEKPVSSLFNFHFRMLILTLACQKRIRSFRVQFL